MPTPPIAKMGSSRRTVHGRLLEDPYAWLRERDEKTLDYLRAENEYTREVMADTDDFREALYREMRARIQETDCSAPVPWGDFGYYTRTEQDRAYPIHCRTSTRGEGAEEILLDLNALVGGAAFIDLGVLELSPDQRLLAYSTDIRGDERYDLVMTDISTGEALGEPIAETGAALAWANDARTFFYLTLDEANRPYRVYRHAAGADPSESELIYEETDDAFHLDLHRTRSGRFLLIVAESSKTSEVRYVEADRPTDPFRVLAPRRPGVEYVAEHQGESFWIVTNDGATNFKLMEAPLADPAPERWLERIPERPNVLLESVEGFARHLVLSEREAGLTAIRVIETDSWGEHSIELPEPLYHVTVGENLEYDTQSLRLEYSSLITPDSSFDYDMTQRKLELRKRMPVLGYERERFTMERIEAQAPDGERVSISLAYAVNARANGPAPLWLTGYGAYGLSYDPEFKRNRISLLERGVVFGIAHIRGGSELGRRWYNAGRLAQKSNTFADFVACARHLVTEGYTTPDTLAIEGASAGGLLIGAVLNAHPDLCRVAVADVPFVDVLNTMLDPSLPLTVIEYDEWGDPNDPDLFEYIASYSPYDNVSNKDYPHMLVLAGLHDPRVSYWEPAKWVARLRAHKTGSNELLLKTNLHVGHHGETDRYRALREDAFSYTFVLKYLGLTQLKGSDNTA